MSFRIIRDMFLPPATMELPQFIIASIESGSGFSGSVEAAVRFRKGLF